MLPQRASGSAGRIRATLFDVFTASDLPRGRTLNIKHVQYFVSVAEHGSFSAAAREHGISVQAMSKAMTDLEKEFGESLFERNHQGIELTLLGDEFLRKAKPVCEEFRQLEQMGETHARENAKLKLFLCAPAFLRNRKARTNLATFFDTYLGVETEIAIGTGEQGIEALRSRACDALITIGPYHHPDFDCFTAGTLPAGLCMAKNHPLASLATVSLDDLAPYPVISSKYFDHFNESILVRYRKAGLRSPIVEPSAYDMPRQFYLKRGVCFMVNVASLGEMFPRSIMKPLAPEDAKSISICLITLKGLKTASYDRLEQLLRARA